MQRDALLQQDKRREASSAACSPCPLDALTSGIRLAPPEASLQTRPKRHHLGLEAAPQAPDSGQVERTSSWLTAMAAARLPRA